MKISDIKPGMTVFLRDGRVFDVVKFSDDETLKMVRCTGRCMFDKLPLCAYDYNDLTHPTRSALDIMRIKDRNTIVYDRKLPTLQDLKVGMVLVLRDDEMFLVGSGCELIGFNGNIYTLRDYTNELRHFNDRNYDIVGVYSTRADLTTQHISLVTVWSEGGARHE